VYSSDFCFVLCVHFIIAINVPFINNNLPLVWLKIFLRNSSDDLCQNLCEKSIHSAAFKLLMSTT